MTECLAIHQWHSSIDRHCWLKSWLPVFWNQESVGGIFSRHQIHNAPCRHHCEPLSHVSVGAKGVRWDQKEDPPPHFFAEKRFRLAGNRSISASVFLYGRRGHLCLPAYQGFWEVGQSQLGSSSWRQKGGRILGPGAPNLGVLGLGSGTVQKHRLTHTHTHTHTDTHTQRSTEDNLTTFPWVLRRPLSADWSWVQRGTPCCPGVPSRLPPPGTPRPCCRTTRDPSLHTEYKATVQCQQLP